MFPKCTPSLLTLCLLLLVGTQLRAATYTVTASTGTGPGSLPFIINNQAVASDIILFGPSVTTCVLPQPLNINYNLTIRGNGKSVTVIEPQNPNRLFTINNTSVLFEKLTLRNGQAFGRGGAVLGQNSSIILVEVKCENNQITAGGGISGGGAIALSGGYFQAIHSCFFSNRANRSFAIEASGGAVYLTGLTGADFISCEFIGNRAEGGGGGAGISNSQRVYMKKTKFSDNSALLASGRAGGLALWNCQNAYVTASQFSGNVAVTNAGGILQNAGSLTIVGSEISFNNAQGSSANQGGGGIFSFNGRLQLDGVNIISNRAQNGAGLHNGANNALTVSGGTFQANVATAFGGGIRDISGPGTITEIVGGNFTKNASSTTDGGAIHTSNDSPLELVKTIFQRNSAARQGGGVWHERGRLTVTNGCFFRSNTAMGTGLAATDGGGAIYNFRGDVWISNANMESNRGRFGGAILNFDGALEIVESSLIANRCTQDGGAIADFSGTGTTTVLADVKIGQNRAISISGRGGGFYKNGPGLVLITNGNVYGNEARINGGGLANDGGDMRISRSNIFENTTHGTNDINDGGAGIYNLDGNLSVEQSAIYDNEDVGGGVGGGILSAGTAGSLRVSATTISQNNTATGADGLLSYHPPQSLEVTRSTIYGHTGDGLRGEGRLEGTIVAINGVDVIGDFTGDNNWISLPVVGILNGGNNYLSAGNPDLQPLATNGFFTPSHVPNCGSPVIGAGGGFQVDQYGQQVVGNQDIGAVEDQGPCAMRTAPDGIEVAAEPQLPDGEEISVFPNPLPNGNTLTITVPAGFGDRAQIRLLSLGGRLLETLEQPTGTSTLTLKARPAGVYLLQVSGNDRSTTTRLRID